MTKVKRVICRSDITNFVAIINRCVGFHSISILHRINMDRYSPSLTGVISTVLPVELVSKIWSFMPLTDLLHYATTSSVNYNDIHNGIRNSVHQILAHFITDTERFLTVLREEHACISGSVVVHVLQGMCLEGGAMVEKGWFPKDVDVYVPRPEVTESDPPFVTYMITVEGYHKVSRKSLPPCIHYRAYPEVRDLVVLRKGRLRMDVIVSASLFSLMPILRFHSTIVMNCITGNGIWSVYPGMTCDGRGIYNSMVFAVGDIVPKMPPASVRAAYKKYALRGFDIRRCPGSWPGDDHVCTKHGSCPHTYRTAEDWSCLYVSLRSIGEDVGLGSRKGNISRDVSAEDAQVVWFLGGRSCSMGGRGLKGYVSCREELVD